MQCTLDSTLVYLVHKTLLLELHFVLCWIVEVSKGWLQREHLIWLNCSNQLIVKKLFWIAQADESLGHWGHSIGVCRRQLVNFALAYYREIICFWGAGLLNFVENKFWLSSSCFLFTFMLSHFVIVIYFNTCNVVVRIHTINIVVLNLYAKRITEQLHGLLMGTTAISIGRCLLLSFFLSSRVLQLLLLLENDATFTDQIIFSILVIPNG